MKLKTYMVTTLVTAAVTGQCFAAAPIISVADLKAQQVVLKPVWQVRGNNNYFFPSSNYSEISQYSGIEQLWYVADSNSTTGSRAPIYRLFNGYQHLVSPNQSESTYYSQGVLGYPWTSKGLPALSNMYRLYNKATGDHALAAPGFVYSGYDIQENFPGRFGYPRPPASQNTKACLQGSEIRLCSDRRVGGAVTELSWGGKNLVNTLDYGRYIQSSLSLGPLNALPTEGGDNAFHTSTISAFKHGSPTDYLMTDVSQKTQSSRSVPLEWNYASHGGSSNQPVAYYPWRLGKDVRLDYSQLNLGSGNGSLIGNIVQYESVISLPASLGSSTSWLPSIEIPTGYVDNAGTNALTRFFTFDATLSDINTATKELSAQDFSASPPDEHYQYDPLAGGVILSSSTGSHAIGVYARRYIPNRDGYVYFTLWRFGNTNKWSAAYYGPLYEGENRFRSYVVAGTLTEVRTAMRALYQGGY